MNQKNSYPISTEFKQSTHINETQYHAMYKRSINEPVRFWEEQAKQFISWFEPWQSVTKGDFNSVDMTWFINGKLNACYNCVDCHLPKRKNQVAIIWEGNHPNETKRITYQQLYEQICQFANVLKTLGIKKGDRVCIYLPMIPEAVIAMLASFAYQRFFSSTAKSKETKNEPTAP